MTATMPEMLHDELVELTAPCEAKTGCDLPAGWLFRFDGPCLSERLLFLLCLDHAAKIRKVDQANAGRWHCPFCGGPLHIVESRPL